MMHRLGFAWVVFAGIGIVGCATTQARPTLSPSMDLPAHAMAYPEHVSVALTRMQEDEAVAREQIGAFAKYPGQLKRPDFEAVAEIVQLADEEGRGQAYVDAVDRQRVVAQFLAQNDRALGGKIAGSVKRATEDKGCSEDVGPIAFYATRRAMTKQLGEALRENNAAQHAITERENALGKRNLRALRDQVDAVSLTSHTAHVGLYDDHREVTRLAAERGDAEATLARVADELQAVIDDPQRNPQAKQFAKKRLDEVHAGQAQMTTLARTLEQATQEGEARVEALRNDYQAALDGLLETLEQLAEPGATPPPTPATPARKRAPAPAAAPSPAPSPAPAVSQNSGAEATGSDAAARPAHTP